MQSPQPTFCDTMPHGKGAIYHAAAQSWVAAYFLSLIAPAYPRTREIRGCTHVVIGWVSLERHHRAGCVCNVEQRLRAADCNAARNHRPDLGRLRHRVLNPGQSHKALLCPFPVNGVYQTSASGVQDRYHELLSRSKQCKTHVIRKSAT